MVTNHLLNGVILQEGPCMSYVPTFTINTSTKPKQILRSPKDSMAYGKWSIPEPIFVSQKWDTKLKKNSWQRTQENWVRASQDHPRGFQNQGFWYW